MDKIIQVGKLSIFRSEILGNGRLGNVFTGKLKNITEEIAIKQMKKRKVRIDSSLYTKANGQPNIVAYYATDHSTDIDFV